MLPAASPCSFFTSTQWKKIVIEIRKDIAHMLLFHTNASVIEKPALLASPNPGGGLLLSGPRLLAAVGWQDETRLHF